jgi:hypothetical protein
MFTHILVPTAELRSDNKPQFTIEVRKSDETRSILFRTYDDIWALHISLLNFFPAESGRVKGVGRCIPFLREPPSGPPRGAAGAGSGGPAGMGGSGWSPAEVQKRRREVEVYMQELLRLQNKNDGGSNGGGLWESGIVRRFFLLRKGDQETSHELGFDVSGALMDLIDTYDSDAAVLVKLNLGGGNGGSGELVQFKVRDNISFDELWEVVEDTLRARISGLGYKDECGMLVGLHGEEDWRLLVRTWGERLVLFPR